MSGGAERPRDTSGLPASYPGSTAVGSGRAPWWERVFLPAHHPSNLAILRMLLGMYFVYFLAWQRAAFVTVATRSEPEVFFPVGVTALLSEPLPAALYSVLYTSCQIAAVLFTLGLFYRLSGPVFGLLMLFVLTYRQGFGFIYHTDNLMALHAMVVGFAPAAHVLSLDRWVGTVLRRRPRRSALVLITRPVLSVMTQGPNEPRSSYRYGWPLQLTLLCTGVVYWVAGMAKIGRAGVSLDWVVHAHLFEHIGNNALRYEFLHRGALDITRHVFSWPPAVIVGLSAGSLMLELMAPLMVLPGPVRWFFGLGLWSFHVGVKVVMGIPFHYQLRGFAFAPIVRWDRLWLRGQAAVSKRFRRPTGLPGAPRST